MSSRNVHFGHAENKHPDSSHKLRQHQSTDDARVSEAEDKPTGRHATSGTVADNCLGHTHEWERFVQEAEDSILTITQPQARLLTIAWVLHMTGGALSEALSNKRRDFLAIRFVDGISTRRASFLMETQVVFQTLGSEFARLLATTHNQQHSHARPKLGKEGYRSIARFLGASTRTLLNPQHGCLAAYINNSHHARGDVHYSLIVALTRY